MILLRFKSKQVGMEVYNIPWVGNSKYNTKDIYFMIQRSQIPLEISIRGFLPTISLEYFTKVYVIFYVFFVIMYIIYYTITLNIIGDKNKIKSYMICLFTVSRDDVILFHNNESNNW